jgi:hypothetical protein
LTPLYALSKCQLVADAPRIKSDGEALLKVVGAQVRANSVPPGGTAWGLISSELPKGTNGPTVLKFVFPPDGPGEVIAVMFL